jgi:diguanylate cyclase (GGDEF)-like protein
MYHNVEHSESNWEKTKVGRLFGNFPKLMERGWASGYPIHSLPSLAIPDFLHKVPRPLWISMGLAFVAFVGVKSLPMSAEVSYWIFYLIPVFLVTWFSKKWVGIMISSICAFTLFVADISSWITYSQFSIPYWGAIARLGSFLILTFTFSSLKSALRNEKEFSRRDSLSGVGNRRYFSELAEMEIHRSMRYGHPFTIIYIDLDDFKIINDNFGHSKGDQVLRAVAQAIQKEIRSTDKIARLGGDEFVVLLPETGFEAAEVIFSKIRRVSAEITQSEAWPITFSMGGATFTGPPAGVDEILRISDSLMYAVKNGGKNGIKHEMYLMDQDRLRKS